jgi:hypothetical protein
MINKILNGFVVILVGTSILSEVSRQINFNQAYNIFETKSTKPEKQTYFQYVQERIAVERKMRKTNGFFWWL